MQLTRRKFLGATAATGAAVALRPTFSFLPAGASPSGDVIVLVFLRGGMDGLSLVAPANMASYRTLRPTIRVKTPDEFGDPTGVAGLPLEAGGNVGAFALDGEFYLHPWASELYNSAWLDGNLAIVHAAGMPASESDSRSHFSSQRNWEIGSGSQNMTQGFLNRYLEQTNSGDLVSGVAMDSQLAASLVGPETAFSMTSVPDFGVSGFLDNGIAAGVLDTMYQGGSNEAWGEQGAVTLDAVDTVGAVNWNAAGLQPANGATYGNSSFGKSLRQVAQLIKADIGLSAAAVTSGGWDTHETMGMPEEGNSRFGGQAQGYSDVLSAFYTDLGSLMGSVTLIAVSEFGRTINENANGGTDHGRATAIMAMGNNVTGGVHGAFVPQIVDGPEGDLAVLNDYRTVVGEVLVERGGLANASSVFPTWTPQSFLGVCA